MDENQRFRDFNQSGQALNEVSADALELHAINTGVVASNSSFAGGSGRVVKTKSCWPCCKPRINSTVRPVVSLMPARGQALLNYRSTLAWRIRLERRDLAGVSNHLLRDIGVSPDDARLESRRRFSAIPGNRLRRQ
ncbi:MAG: DUF1127 domain-containing protein [Burkholderiaceae bacterium]